MPWLARASHVEADGLIGYRAAGHGPAAGHPAYGPAFAALSARKLAMCLVAACPYVVPSLQSYDEPLIEIDHWGERLKGCLRCNRWQTSTGEKCRLAPDDIMALRALKVTKTETPEQPAGPRIESS